MLQVLHLETIQKLLCPVINSPLLLLPMTAITAAAQGSVW